MDEYSCLCISNRALNNLDMFSHTREILKFVRVLDDAIAAPIIPPSRQAAFVRKHRTIMNRPKAMRMG